MAKRDDAAARKEAMSSRERQAAAGRANLEKGRKKKLAMKEQAEREVRTTAGERWAMLLDGRLSVRDLDDEEIRRMSVRAKDGTIARGRTMPSHIAQAYTAETIRRAQKMFREHLPKAIEALGTVVTDPDASNADKIKAANIIVDRVMGKALERVHVEGPSPFDALSAEAIGLDRDLAGDALPQGEHVVGDEA